MNSSAVFTYVMFNKQRVNLFGRWPSWWPRIARYRETISAISPYCALWVFGVSTWPIGCDTPPFSEHFPLGEHAKWRCATPPQKGYLSDTCAIPYENKANGCDTPLCDTISKGYCAIWGGISHWAAKVTPSVKGGCLPARCPGVRDVCAIGADPRNINLFAQVHDWEDRWLGWPDRVQQDASITWCDLFRPNFGKKMPEFISVPDVWEPWKQALLASRDVIISSQFAARIRRGFFTLGDGCWLPKSSISENFYMPFLLPNDHGIIWNTIGTSCITRTFYFFFGGGGGELTTPKLHLHLWIVLELITRCNS